MKFSIGRLLRVGSSNLSQPDRKKMYKEILLTKKVLPLKTRVFEAPQSPCTSDPTDRLDKLQEGYTVKIKKGTKRTTLFRFLLAKLVYDPEEGLHLDEFLVLWNLGQELEEISLRDDLFKSKWDDFLLKAHLILAEVDSREFPIRLQFSENQRAELIEFLGEHFPRPEAYFGLKGNRELRSSYSILFGSQVKPQYLRQKRFVGVGYKDHGMHRDLARDGSPTWKEVSHVVSQLERMIQEGDLTWEDIPGKLKKLLPMEQFPE